MIRAASVSILSALVLSALVLVGCSDAPVNTADSTGSAGSDNPTAVPADADAACEAILDRCHGPRRGGFDRAFLEIRVPAATAADTVLLRLPDDIRVSRADGTTELLATGVALRWRNPDAVEPLTDERRDELARLRDALALVCLQPLERRTAAARRSADTIALQRSQGSAPILLHHEGDRPRRIVDGEVEVEFLDFHSTPTTRVPLAVHIRGIGACQLRFTDTGVRFPESTFRAPDREAERVDVSGAPGSTPARIAHEPEVDRLLIPDDGDWSAESWPPRIERLYHAAERLAAAGYGGAGDPALTSVDGKPQFVLPFAPLADTPSPIDLADGERRKPRGAVRLAILELPAGPFEDRIAAGRRQLDAWCAERGLEPAGPLEIAINVAMLDPSQLPDVLDRVLITLRYPLE